MDKGVLEAKEVKGYRIEVTVDPDTDILFEDLQTKKDVFLTYYSKDCWFPSEVKKEELQQYLFGYFKSGDKTPVARGLALRYHIFPIRAEFNESKVKSFYFTSPEAERNSTDISSIGAICIPTQEIPNRADAYIKAKELLNVYNAIICMQYIMVTKFSK